MKHLLEQMTFVEFRTRMSEDPVMILPLGSVEVQGPHNPMGDFMLSSVLAARVAERTGAIAAATMPFGVAEVFRPVPGGMQLSPEAFRLVLRDLIGGFLDHGLERILVLNGHTGNHAGLVEVTRDIRRERGIVVPWLNIWPMIPRRVLEEAHGAGGARAAGHGADPIGSVYEALFPTLRRADIPVPAERPRTLIGLPTGGLASVKLGDVEVFVPIHMLDHCEAVVGGDPALSNAKAGEIFANYIVDTASALVEHLKTAETRVPFMPRQA